MNPGEKNHALSWVRKRFTTFGPVAVEHPPSPFLAGDQSAGDICGWRLLIGSVKRGPLALGKDAIAVQFVEEYLKET